MRFTKTKTVAASEVDQDILGQLKNIDTDPEIVRLHLLSETLKGEKARVLRELMNCSTEGPTGPAVRYDASADAAALLAGAAVSSLDAPAAENNRFGLLRQLRGLERAIPECDDRKRAVFFAVCQREVERLRPRLAESYAGVLMAFEALQVELRRHHEVLSAILTHGMYYQTLGPWILTPAENQLLFGGNMNPDLGNYIASRRETLGMKESE